MQLKYKPNQKAVVVKIDNKLKRLPVIYYSYKYTLWILSHKYKDIELYDIVYYDKLEWQEVGSKIEVKLPPKVPKYLLDINDTKEVVNYFGVEEYLLLNDFTLEAFNILLDLLVKGEIKNEKSKVFKSYVTAFDRQLAYMSLSIPKVHGKPLLYKGVPLYKLSGVSRKGFNKVVDRVREQFNVASNRVTNVKTIEPTIKLSKTEREYMETQLQEFFILLHERILHEQS